MKVKYKIIKDRDGAIISCNECYQEVPLKEFSNDRETKLLCEFCASVVGSRRTSVTKDMLCQAMNVLYEKLKKCKK